MVSMDRLNLVDPMAFVRLVWPHIDLYDKQREIMYSVRDNYQTFVPAGNMLGKDFISAMVVLYMFCTRRPCRVGTTSAQFEQLNDILWGEIRWLLSEAKYKLPVYRNEMKLRQLRNDGTIVDKSEVIGKVVKKGEAFLGRHPGLKDVPRTLLVIDECSGVDDETYDKASTWADRILCVGNCYPCSNFWFKELEKGEEKMDDGTYYRKIIRITAEDSPNVKYAKAEIESGKSPSGRVLIPGVITYKEYKMREKYWDEEKKCVSLYGDFYKGETHFLFPHEWLEYSWELWKENYCEASGLGVDPAEGGDNTCWSVIGEEDLLNNSTDPLSLPIKRARLIELRSEKTKDTSTIPRTTAELMEQYNLDAKHVYFDQGGGGKEHADYMRRCGLKVKTVFFGQTATEERDYKKRWKSPTEKVDIEETRHTYKNRRAELYHKASMKMNPAYGGIALPPPSKGPQYEELYRQLKAMPKLTDSEGRYYLPPKRPRPNSTEESLEDILGCSPDEADSFVLGLWAIEERKRVVYL